MKQSLIETSFEQILVQQVWYLEQKVKKFLEQSLKFGTIIDPNVFKSTASQKEIHQLITFITKIVPTVKKKSKQSLF